jgi:hypothetical protein
MRLLAQRDSMRHTTFAGAMFAGFQSATAIASPPRRNGNGLAELERLLHGTG